MDFKGKVLPWRTAVYSAGCVINIGHVRVWAHMIRRKTCGNIIHAPNWSIKIRQAETNKGFVSIYSLGLFGSDGCGFAAVAGKRKKSGRAYEPIP